MPQWALPSVGQEMNKKYDLVSYITKYDIVLCFGSLDEQIWKKRALPLPLESWHSLMIPPRLHNQIHPKMSLLVLYSLSFATTSLLGTTSYFSTMNDLYIIRERFNNKFREYHN